MLQLLHTIQLFSEFLGLPHELSQFGIFFSRFDPLNNFPRLWLINVLNGLLGGLLSFDSFVGFQLTEGFQAFALVKFWEGFGFNLWIDEGELNGTVILDLWLDDDAPTPVDDLLRAFVFSEILLWFPLRVFSLVKRFWLSHALLFILLKMLFSTKELLEELLASWVWEVSNFACFLDFI